MVHMYRNDIWRQADISRIIFVYKLPIQPVMLDLVLEVKALALQPEALDLQSKFLACPSCVSSLDLGLVPCGLVNITAVI